MAPQPVGGVLGASVAGLPPQPPAPNLVRPINAPVAGQMRPPLHGGAAQHAKVWWVGHH